MFVMKEGAKREKHGVRRKKFNKKNKVNNHVLKHVLRKCRVASKQILYLHIKVKPLEIFLKVHKTNMDFAIFLPTAP